MNRYTLIRRRWRCKTCMLAFLLAGFATAGCSDAGNRLVEIDPSSVPVQTPEQAQAEADAALPKT